MPYHYFNRRYWKFGLQHFAINLGMHILKNNIYFMPVYFFMNLKVSQQKRNFTYFDHI